MNNIKTDKTYQGASNTPIIDETKPMTDDFKYIGDDGKLYSTPQALEEANKTYWENWKKINSAGGVRDLSHLRALDGSYHSTPEGIQEANENFRKRQIELEKKSNLQRTELLNQLLANPKYALECAGLEFIKQIYQIDPQITRDILELILTATKDGKFENLDIKLVQTVSTQAGIQQHTNKQR